MKTIFHKPNPSPGHQIATPERFVDGLGLKLEPRLGSVEGLGVGEGQQTTGQGRLEHRSKARRAGPGAKLVRLAVTAEARGCVSQRRAAEPPPSRLSLIPSLQTHPGHAPSSKEDRVPGSPVVKGDCRSSVVPKFWLDLLGKGGLSSEGLEQPEQGGLGVLEKQEGQEDRDREGGKEGGTGRQEPEAGGRSLTQTRTRGAWPHRPQGAGAGAGPGDRKWTRQKS